MLSVDSKSRGDSSALTMLAVAAALVACALPAHALTRYEAPGVTLFEDADFRGYSETFIENIPNLNSSRFGNNTASSIRVDRECRVTLYSEIGYRGRSVRLRGDEPDLGRTPVGNDAVSSMEIDCGRSGGGYGDGGYGSHDDPWDGYGIVLYEHTDFRGVAELFEDDVRTLERSRLGNDRASSIRVGPGCEAELYADADFRGASLVLNRDITNLGETRIGNDSVSSLRVNCDKGFTDEGVVLFSNEDFRGRREIFTRDDGNLSNNPIRNDSVSSVRVARGCQATLYSDINFRGAATVITYDAPSLRNSRVGNDGASSIQVSCRGDDPNWDGKRGAVLYSDEDFRGRSEVLSGDDRDLRDNPIRNDSISSVRVAPGCKVTLFSDTGFRGASTVLTADAPSLTRSRVGNDRASSVRIECGYHGGGGDDGGRDWDDWRDRRGVRLYSSADFQGRSEIFLEDDRDLRNNEVGNDAVSSVRVSRGCRAILYSDTNYNGRSVVISEDTSSLGGTRIGNDAASSVRVECDRPGTVIVPRPSPPGVPNKPAPPGLSQGVTVYSGENFTGREETFLEDDRNLRDNRIGNDAIRSIRLAPGCRAMLYEDDQFGGRSMLVRQDLASLSGQRVGNDRATSIEVDCRGRR